MVLLVSLTITHIEGVPGILFMAHYLDVGHWLLIIIRTLTVIIRITAGSSIVKAVLMWHLGVVIDSIGVGLHDLLP